MNESPAASSPPDPKRFRRAVEYHGARTLVYCLSLLPLSVASWIGRRLGDVARIFDRRHRERAMQQVSERLGLGPEEARAFVKRNFRNYGMSLAEFARLRRMRAHDFTRFIDMEEFGDCCRKILAENKGLIFITAHFGNWEWCNSMAAHFGFTGGSIARPLDNARLNEYVRSIREKNGLRILDKLGAIRKALGALKNNQLVGILIDQDAGHQGMMSPFLGKPASTLTIPVELAMRTGAPLVVVGLRRGGTKGKRFTILHTREPICANPDADPDVEVHRILDTLNDELGKIIMQAPDQWFWIHRRWKSEGLKK